ncbi:MAG TPA: MgtC/SapB family protein [Acidimicrobiales bacterium]|nr:MgtC/SapB family protein [Acidimicrobiales bacterium]
MSVNGAWLAHVGLANPGSALLAAASPSVAGAPNVEGWAQLGELGLAFVLSALIGIEREVRQKSAGLRTYTLVGVGAALFMLVSKYGFNDVLAPGRVVLDPSRVAAQIVTGIGFLGAGLIFVRRGSVHGLTTAAGVWVTAAVGSAAGAGLPVLAALTTAIYFLVTTAFKWLAPRLPGAGPAVATVRARYPQGQGILGTLLGTATARGFTIDSLSTDRPDDGKPGRPGQDGPGQDGTAQDGRILTELTLQVHGKSGLFELTAALSEIPGVEAVMVEDLNGHSE